LLAYNILTVPETLKESAAFIYPEEGGSISLRNVSNHARY